MKLSPIITGLALCCACFTQAVEIAPPPGEPVVEAIPEKYVDAKKLGLMVELQVKREGADHHSLGVRLINPTKQAVHFTGYAETSPLYRIQLWRDGKWVEHQVGWFCGTGLRSCVVKPGMSSVISVSVKSEMYPLRVGVDYSNKPEGAADKVVWSEKIES